MATGLPSRPNLDWLRKTARQRLRDVRVDQPGAKLADIEYLLAREYGFSSWRSLKAHVDALNRSGSTDDASPTDAQAAAFLRAVGEGQLDAARSLSRVTPRLVNAVGPHPYWGGRPQALHVSIETARPDMYEFLLSSGADVDGRNEEYEHTSPLSLTVLWRQPQMQQDLVARGARIGLVEALLLADDVRVAEMLRRGKSALPRYKPNGGSILAMARTPLAIDRLLELGAPLDLKDRWGASPIEAFSRLGSHGMPLVRHLQARGIPVSPREYARMGDRESLERFLGPNPGFSELNEVFTSAAEFGHHELIEWLISRGADVNAKSTTGNGWTALHSAAWEGDLRMVQLLVAAGADLSIQDTQHRATPAVCARVAIGVTNNPACEAVAEYLERLQIA